MTSDNLIQLIPILISVLSLAIAAFAIGWNIFRDIALKARVKVHVAVVPLIYENQLFVKQTNAGKEYIGEFVGIAK